MNIAWTVSGSPLSRGIALVLCAGLAGCAGGNGRGTGDALPAPTMPTIGPVANTQPTPVPEGEIVAEGLRLALRNDLPGALRAVARAADPDARVRVGNSLVTALAAQNPAASASVALGLPAGPGQSEALAIAAQALVQRDAPAALRWAMELPDSTAATEARRAVAGRLVRENSRENLDRIAALPPSPARDALLGFGAAAWAHHDANGAVAWLRDLPDNPLRQQLTSSVAFEIAQTAPDRAIALAESLPAGRNRWLIVSAITQTWIIKDPAAAMAWTTQLPKGDARDAALAGVETGLGVPSGRRPNPATRVRSPSSRSAAGGGAFTSWPAENDPPAFAIWLASQPGNLTRDEAILEFLRQRGSQDVGTMGNWVASLPGGTTRQRAIEIYFDEVVRGSPANAANWLRSLPSGDRSDEMIEKTARQWLQTDPRAAEAWLRETTLPPFRKEELLRNVPR